MPKPKKPSAQVVSPSGYNVYITIITQFIEEFVSLHSKTKFFRISGLQFYILSPLQHSRCQLNDFSVTKYPPTSELIPKQQRTETFPPLSVKTDWKNCFIAQRNQ